MLSKTYIRAWTVLTFICLVFIEPCWIQAFVEHIYSSAITSDSLFTVFHFDRCSFSPSVCYCLYKREHRHMISDDVFIPRLPANITDTYSYYTTIDFQSAAMVPGEVINTFIVLACKCDICTCVWNIQNTKCHICACYSSHVRLLNSSSWLSFLLMSRHSLLDILYGFILLMLFV